MTCIETNAARASLLAGAALVLFTAPASALAARHDPAERPPTAGVSTGTCPEGAIAYTVATDLQTTRSTTYRDIAGTGVAFMSGASGCAEVSFSAEAATTPGELILVRVFLDNNMLCMPAGNIFASDSPSSDLADHAMNYICPTVGPGNHTVRVQWRSRFGGKVAVDYRTTIVRYTP